MTDENETGFKIDAGHPCLAGHFPDNPIVPGVVILDEISCLISTKYKGYKVTGFSSVKFIAPLLAEQVVIVQVGNKTDTDNQRSKVKFTSSSNKLLIAQGEVKLEKVDQS